MLATTANSIWPAVWPATVQAVSYAQVGDFFKMLVQREKSDYAACEFCRTVNSQYAVRCRTCGGKISPPSEEDTVSEPFKPARTTSSDARALRKVLTMVLVPPMILFASFGAWHQLEFENPDSGAANAKTLPLSVSVAPVPIAVGSSQDRLVSELLTARRTIGREETDGNAGPPSTEVQTEVMEQDDTNHVLNGGSALPRVAKSSPSRTKDTGAGSGRQRQDVLAGCSGLSFFARAVCVNNRCAEPKAARVGQCREAVRQRRIDEARRNPVLMG
ncbi:hypothetical protein [Variovorax sp. GT1P44]|uniref:hypothetical protein n=1 Tax=Variovorax sp. GT1P44 TaxID=3443742 RepID=UPI003F4744B2